MNREAKTEPAQCVFMVRDKDQSGTFRIRQHQCTRRSVVERDGIPFCKQHDPLAVSARDEARLAEIRAAEERARERRRLEDAKATRDKAFLEACERFVKAFRAARAANDDEGQRWDAQDELAEALEAAQAAYERATGGQA